MLMKLVRVDYQIRKEQKEAVKKLASVRMKAFGIKISDSQIVREIIDDYLKGKDIIWEKTGR